MTLNSHQSGPPENRLTVVFERSQFPPLPVIGALSSTLPLRLQICKRHFPDSLLPAGLLLSYDCGAFWRKIGRQEESSRLFVELLMGAATVAGSGGWRRVTPAVVMGIQHPRFLLDRSEGASRSILTSRSFSPGWEQLYDLWLTLLSHLGTFGPASVFVINAPHESPFWLKFYRVSGFLLDTAWYIRGPFALSGKRTQTKKGGTLGVIGESAVLNAFLF